MKKYLIKIESVENHNTAAVRYNSDSFRPYQIAGNLWNYDKIGYASRRLEMLAKSWENHGFTVRREYGTKEGIYKKA